MYAGTPPSFRTDGPTIVAILAGPGQGTLTNRRTRRSIAARRGRLAMVPARPRRSMASRMSWSWLGTAERTSPSGGVRASVREGWSAMVAAPETGSTWTTRPPRRSNETIRSNCCAAPVSAMSATTRTPDHPSDLARVSSCRRRRPDRTTSTTWSADRTSVMRVADDGAPTQSTDRYDSRGSP